MVLSKVCRGDQQGALTRIVFREFDQNGELPEGSWMPRDGGAFEPLEVPPLPEDEAEPAEPVESLEARLEEAYGRGRQQGLEEARGRLDGATQAFGRALEEIGTLREDLLSKSKNDMLRLVLAIARQVIHAEVSVDRELVLSTIERAVQASVRSDAYQIKVNPEDLALATERKPLFLSSISSLKNISFQADPAVARGGCMVESELGEVDATIETQLEAIGGALMAAAERA